MPLLPCLDGQGDLVSRLMIVIWWFHEIEGIIMGVPITRIEAFWGLYCMVYGAMGILIYSVPLTIQVLALLS